MPVNFEKDFESMRSVQSVGDSSDQINSRDTIKTEPLIKTDTPDIFSNNKRKSSPDVLHNSVPNSPNKFYEEEPKDIEKQMKKASKRNLVRNTDSDESELRDKIIK